MSEEKDKFKTQRMEKQKPKVDYASIQQQALGQFRLVKSLRGKSTAFAPLFKQFLKAALKA